MSQQPPPPQFSPDGLYWWDGTRWIPRAGGPAVQVQQPPPPMYYPPPPPPGYGGTSILGQPSPGLRIVLIVALVIEALASGLLSFAFIVAAVSGGQDAFGYILGALCIGVFLVSCLAVLGAILRTPWSRWMAIAAGILITWTCVGAVLGIPILVTAARAPDLAKKPA